MQQEIYSLLVRAWKQGLKVQKIHEQALVIDPSITKEQVLIYFQTMFENELDTMFSK